MCYRGTWWLVEKCRNVLQGDVIVGGRVSECVTGGRDRWWKSVGMCYRGRDGWR